MVGGGRRRNSSRSSLTGPSRILSKGASSYRENQVRFFSDRPKLARSILDHVDDGLCSIEPKEVERHFRSKWESKELFKGLGRFGVEKGCSNKKLAHPVSAAQVLASRKAIRNGSAAGPDGIRKTCLVRWDPTGVKLARMLTGFQLAGRIPVALKGQPYHPDSQNQRQVKMEGRGQLAPHYHRLYGTQTFLLHPA